MIHVNPEVIGQEVRKLQDIRSFINEHTWSFLPDHGYYGYDTHIVSEESPDDPTAHERFTGVQRVAIHELIPEQVRGSIQDTASPEEWLATASFDDERFTREVSICDKHEINGLVKRLAGRICLKQLGFLDERGRVPESTILALSYMRGDISRELDRSVWDHHRRIEGFATRKLLDSDVNDVLSGMMDK